MTPAIIAANQRSPRRLNGRGGGRRLSTGRIPAAATRIKSKPTSKGIAKNLSTKGDGSPNTLLKKLTSLFVKKPAVAGSGAVRALPLPSPILPVHLSPAAGHGGLGPLLELTPVSDCGAPCAVIYFGTAVEEAHNSGRRRRQ